MSTLTLQRTRALVAAAVLLVVGAGLGYWLAQPTHDSPNDGVTSAPTKPGERRILYWHDPMVPGVRFDKPGKSPFMNMPLVPVHADEEAGGGVRVAANVAQNLGIRIGRVGKATLERRVAAVGSVVFDDRQLELVPARVEGYVTRLYVKSPLERVERGQALAEIQAPAWLEAQQEYLTLLDAKSERGQAVRDAARERLHVLGVPEATIARIERDRTTRATTSIVAPITGVVSELGVREGAAFMPGTVLFRINGLSSVWVNAQIPEAQVSMIPAGSSVQARATAWPGAMFKGEVIALLPQVDEKTRTLTARVALGNPERKLAPGMFVSLDFTAPHMEQQLVVPSEAVIMTGERSLVITAGEGGTFRVAEVKTGVEEGGRTAILEGLREGEPIVLSGQFLIDSEASLRSTVSRLESAPGAAGEP